MKGYALSADNLEAQKKHVKGNKLFPVSPHR